MKPQTLSVSNKKPEYSSLEKGKLSLRGTAFHLHGLPGQATFLCMTVSGRKAVGGDWGCRLAPPPETEETDSFPPVVISKRTLTDQELERLSITSDRILRN